MDNSWSRDFSVTTTVAFGSLTVSLWKKLAHSEFPCAEILYVAYGAGTTDKDINDYIQFHVSFVLHRERHKWCHQFAILYDGRCYDSSWGVKTVIERVMPFILMHSSLGENYKTLLYKVGVILHDKGAVESLQTIIDRFGPPTKPVITVVVKDASTMSDRMRSSDSIDHATSRF